jgi:hypothetical protein
MSYKRFTDEQQAMFILQMETLGYPENRNAPETIARQKGAPSGRTLRRWWKIRHNPDVDKIVQHKKPDLVAALSELLQLHIDAAIEAVQGSEDLRALDTGIGILVDKLELLSGNPTERSQQEITVNRVGTSTLPPHLASRTDANNIRA